MKLALAASALALAALSACGPATTADDTVAPETPRVTLQGVEVTYDASASTYAIDWTLSEAGAPVDILVSSDPSGADATPIVDDITATAFAWSPGDDAPARRYFVVDPENGEPVLAATRVLPLEGGRNFRDLGGYLTEDGRRVRWGQLFRSGVMHGLTDADYDYLSGLGIQTLCDLRTEQERTAEPTEWAAGAIDYRTFPDPEPDGDAAQSFETVFRDPDLSPAKVRDAMIYFYRFTHEQQAPAYTAMFDELANGDIPLAFNCSAGKDRTGVGAALLLTALGVPRETVIADYALSEQVVDFMAEFRESAEEAGPESPYAFLMQLPPEVVEPLMRTEPAYIESTFAAIEAEHGSVLAFIQAELDVDDAELARIRERLLEG